MRSGMADKGLAASLPVPKSKVGTIVHEFENSFIAYVGEMSKEDYNDYVNVNECASAGFNIDYDKSDSYYCAKNVEGYCLSLVLRGVPYKKYIATSPQGTT